MLFRKCIVKYVFLKTTLANRYILILLHKIFYSIAFCVCLYACYTVLLVILWYSLFSIWHPPAISSTFHWSRSIYFITSDWLKIIFRPWGLSRFWFRDDMTACFTHSKADFLNLSMWVTAVRPYVCIPWQEQWSPDSPMMEGRPTPSPTPSPALKQEQV